MNLVEIRVINVESPQWISNLENFFVSVLAELGESNWDISVVLCNDEFIKNLNREYRSLDLPTDVLTFPQSNVMLGISSRKGGDIVISLEQSLANAREYGQTHQEELKRLAIHGILHLVGMDHNDHVSGSDEETLGEMLSLQEGILKKHSEEPLF